jgi:MFS transporter, DHA1 family, multidrug resistance protein
MEDLNKKVFLTLFSAVFATTLGVGLVIPILPVYAHQSGAGGFAIGMIFGAFSLSRTAFVPIFGRWSDRKGRRLFLSMGLLSYCLVSVAFTFSQGIYWLIGVRFVQGIASAMVLPVAYAYVGEIGPPDKEGEIMGLFQISLYGGLSFGPALGGVVKDVLGTDATFLSMGLICFIGFMLCITLLPKDESNLIRNRKLDDSYWTVAKDQTMSALVIMRICLACSIGVIWSFLPLLGEMVLHLNATSIGLLVMTNVAISAVALYPMGVLADRYDKRIPVVAGTVFAVIALILLIRVNTFWDLIIASALHGIALGMISPALIAVVVIVGREKKAMGTAMGLINMGHSMGMLLGPVLGGLIMDVYSFSGAFSFGAVAMLAGTVLLMLRMPSFMALPHHKRNVSR